MEEFHADYIKSNKNPKIAQKPTTENFNRSKFYYKVLRQKKSVKVAILK